MIDNKVKLIAGIILFCIGIGIFMFPWIQARFFDYRQDQLVKKWDAYTLLKSPSGEQISGGAEISLPTEDPNFQGIPIQYDGDNILVENVTPAFDVESVIPYMVGMITIDKINLRSPLLDGSDIHHLDLGICVLDGSPPVGGAGNFCVAGHKSRIRGRHFSRLNELTGGETVLVSDGLKTYQYEVYEILHLTADDLWVLQNVSNDSILTMITCDYTQKPIGRLAVRARLISENNV